MSSRERWERARELVGALRTQISDQDLMTLGAYKMMDLIEEPGPDGNYLLAVIVGEDGPKLRIVPTPQ